MTDSKSLGEDIDEKGRPNKQSESDKRNPNTNKRDKTEDSDKNRNPSSLKGKESPEECNEECQRKRKEHKEKAERL